MGPCGGGNSGHSCGSKAYGTLPEGHTSVWSTLGEACNMLNQHGMLLEGLSDQSICMGEVDLLLVKVQESVTLVINNTTNASRSTASIALCLHQLVTPCTGGPLDEVVAHMGASAASMNTLKDDIARLLGFLWHWRTIIT